MKTGRPYKSLYLPALIIVATVLTLLVVIAISTYRNIDRDRERAENSLLREGLVIIRAVEAGARADSPSSRPDVSRIRRIVEELSREPAVARILLFDGHGEVAASGLSGETAERVGDASSLVLLLREKGLITRYRQAAGGERTFEVITPFRPLAYRNPLALIREGEEKAGPREEPLQDWAKDKVILVGLRPGAFEGARQQDIHHALLMGGILVILGGGALYFIFIVQNYYLVDRSLARMKTYTENVVESMADALISIDGQKRIVTLNRRAADLLGGAEREFKGRGIAEVMGPKVEYLLQGEKPGGIVRDRDMDVKQPSGKLIPLSLSAAPLKDENGQELGSVLLLRDLREIRELQERVRRGERLASLGRLAAGVAHEIRNPLSSIRGFAQFFHQRFKGQEKDQEYASIMIKEVDRLNRVITELLDFARPKEPRREPHSLESILDLSLNLLQPELTAKKVRVEKILEPGLPLVPIDRDQFSQAFLNLLLNALESMDPGGSLRITMNRVEEEGQKRVQVSIADTGRGIPREDLEKVFEPFFSTKRKGTGLGLANVHQIVESHGGGIRVESQEGAGTTFFVTLPF
ncbi:MAG: PAS domain S-box protein [Syntrophaceae bacterium]|nr:PAS domain S-box protein [Syntrophaceae bacterium]